LKNRPALSSRTPKHCHGRSASQNNGSTLLPNDREIGQGERRSAWARLLTKAYEVDVWTCPACGGRMSIIAIIRDPAEIRKIIVCLRKHE
jgi:hypothetical protein